MCINVNITFSTVDKATLLIISTYFNYFLFTKEFGLSFVICPVAIAYSMGQITV